MTSHNQRWLAKNFFVFLASVCRAGWTSSEVGSGRAWRKRRSQGMRADHRSDRDEESVGENRQVPSSDRFDCAVGVVTLLDRRGRSRRWQSAGRDGFEVARRFGACGLVSRDNARRTASSAAANGPQGTQNLLPGSVGLPLLKITVDRTPGWKIPRQHSPRALRARAVQDRVDDAAHRGRAIHPDGSAVRNDRTDVLPFMVRDVGGIIRLALVRHQLPFETRRL